MNKYVLIEDGNAVNFENTVKIFQYLSEKGYFISSVEDGKISVSGSIDGKDWTKTFEFGIISNEKTKDLFISEVDSHRGVLREAVKSLKSQGLFTAEQGAKLKKQFEFLPEVSPSVEKTDTKASK